MLTSELNGPQLNFWVAKALGHKVIMFAGAAKVMDWQKPGSLVRGNPFMPSTSWAQGGPIIERELIDIEHIYVDGAVMWVAAKGDCGQLFEGMTDTPLIAAMRAYVASVYGASVPDEVTA